MGPKPIPWSKQKTKCGHCFTPIRRDRLPEHTTNKHPGLPVKEHGDGDGRTQSTLTRFTKSKDSQADGHTGDHSATASSASPANPVVINSDSDQESCSDKDINVVKRKRKQSDDSEEPSKKKAKLDEGVEIGAAESRNEQSKQSGPTMDEKLDAILDAVKNLKMTREAPKRDSASRPTDASASSQNNEEADIEALKILIQSCRSIQRLCDLANLKLSDDGLICTVCASDWHTGHGVFKYDVDEVGVDFTEGNQPVAFINLKKSVRRHLSTQTHKSNLIKADDDSIRARKLQKLNQTVGLTVGKQAYRTLKYGRPFTDFEIDMLLLSDAKANVGNLNHSEKFPASMRPAFATAIDQRVEKYLKEPLPATLDIPPIGIVADKVTTKRRTGQLYGGVIFTPNMPSLLTPISLGISPVKHHDGRSIAEDICNATNSYNIQPSQIAGYGFDGQYFKLNVPTHINNILELDDMVSFTWDAAHLLQLAEKDTRTKETPWMEDLIKTIAAVLNKFQFGKSFEAAIEKAAALGVDLKAPQWFSDTRFASFAHIVFRNFMDNYKVIRSVLEEIAASDDIRASDACALLGRIRTIDFVTKLLVCVDFYGALGEISNVLQKVDMPIWDKARALKEYFLTLEKQQAWEDQEWKKVRHHEDEIMKCEFFGFPVLVGNVGLMIPRRRLRGQQEMETSDSNEESNSEETQPEHDPAVEKLTRLKELASNLIQSMVQNMHNRFPHSFFLDIETKEKSASLLPLLKRAQLSSNESQLMQSSEVNTLLQMHTTQNEGVRNLCVNIFRRRAALKDCDTDIKLYHKLYSDPTLYTGAQHILATLAKIISSSPPESIVESMGSVVENIRQLRGGSKTSTNRRDVEDLSQELIIHWNGPHISHCDSLVSQALTIHFKGSAWHFNSTDVRSKLHKVSAVVDRLHKTTPKLNFMTNL